VILHGLPSANVACSTEADCEVGSLQDAVGSFRRVCATLNLTQLYYRCLRPSRVTLEVAALITANLLTHDMHESHVVVAYPWTIMLSGTFVGRLGFATHFGEYDSSQSSFVFDHCFDLIHRITCTQYSRYMRAEIGGSSYMIPL
jgi:hypothetical protein